MLNAFKRVIGFVLFDIYNISLSHLHLFTVDSELVSSIVRKWFSETDSKQSRKSFQQHENAHDIFHNYKYPVEWTVPGTIVFKMSAMSARTTHTRIGSFEAIVAWTIAQYPYRFSFFEQNKMLQCILFAWDKFRFL